MRLPAATVGDAGEGTMASEEPEDTEALRQSRDQLHALSMRLLDVREEERTRIAHDLHDELGQSLTALKMQLAALGAAPPATPQELRGQLDALGQLVDQMVQTVRRISTDLRPVVLDRVGLAAGVDCLAAEFRASAGIACEMTADLRGSEVSPSAATAIYRIVQEALTNVARHARAHRVRILLRARDGEIRLDVDDDGVGLGPPVRHSPPALGLLGIRERAAILGGRAEVVGRAAGGTSVRVRIPHAARVPADAIDP